MPDMTSHTAHVLIVIFIAVGGSVWFLFLVRIFAALFSAKVRDIICKRPRLHFIWGCLALFCFLGTQFFLSGGWPPVSFERANQMKVLEERVQTNGGWEVLRQNCISLMDQHKDEYFSSHWHDTNGLPPMIAALKPMSVEYFPRQYLSELKDGKFTTPPNVHVVRIKIFGMHSTGGHSTPFLGLEVFMGDESGSYLPKSEDAVVGNRHMNYKKVAENIYETF